MTGSNVHLPLSLSFSLQVQCHFRKMILSKKPETRSPGEITLLGRPPESPGETDQKTPALATVITLITQGDSCNVFSPRLSSSKGELGCLENFKQECPLITEVSLGLTVSKGGSEGGLWLSPVQLRRLSDLLSPQPALGAHWQPLLSGTCFSAGAGPQRGCACLAEWVLKIQIGGQWGWVEGVTLT